MPSQTKLEWKSYGNGRLHVAITPHGFYELEQDGRMVFCRLVNGLLTRSDMGPCTFATLDSCKQACEEHRRGFVGG